MDLGHFYRRNAKLYPNKTVFIYKDIRITFKEFNERVNRLINAISDMAIEKRDRVAIISKNCHQYFEVYGVAEKGGRIIVPLNFRLAGKELAYQINDSEAKVLFVSQEYLDTIDSIRSDLKTVKNFICIGDKPQYMENYEEVVSRYPADEPDVDINEDDIVYLLYTSGTTGLSKGVALTHRANVENAKCYTIELGIRRDDITMDMLPIWHIGSRSFAIMAFQKGCTHVIMDEFDPLATLEIIEKEKVTILPLIPTTLAFLVDSTNIEKYDLSSLRLIHYAGSPMPLALLKKAVKKFGNIFFQSYGQTESGPLISVLSKEDHIWEGCDEEVERLASVGAPIPYVDVRIVDQQSNDLGAGEVGEIIVKSDHIMKGYWKNPEMTAETIKDGWLYTGDMGKFDEKGYIYIVDRRKDMIISGGENIFSREVEEVLYTHPSVLEAAVIGIPDEKWGESVKALIVLKKGKKATEEEIIEYCKRNLTSYKKPKSVEFMDSLPKNPTGKILKRELREKYWKRYERKI